MEQGEVTITIKFVDNQTFANSLEEHGLTEKYSRIRLRLTRGFIVNNTMYIRKGTRIGLAKLILHEIGHAMGKKHTWLPTVMNPTWVFRWF